MKQIYLRYIFRMKFRFQHNQLNLFTRRFDDIHHLRHCPREDGRWHETIG